MVDELSRRRHNFQPGRKLRLANGQLWVFPTPRVPGDPTGFQADAEYRPLLDSVREADSDAERALAELALAVFLLSWNYDLSPSEYQELLSFPAGSPAVEEWRGNMSELACAHIGGPLLAKEPGMAYQGWFSRLLARFRPSPTDQ
ncbi:hypothetical protein [Paludisphaera borealis]|uniref:Uncharacterized protein n=1 Tax=Paludisphaera borealis TaxID=1387353 RepID=A0A1U7CLX8_9BACT|nr:hypothetical protein [Paludisphaera borealis]APW59916.1 hypothetical protein BSF38_01377 [Paludisphaera borealis]